MKDIHLLDCVILFFIQLSFVLNESPLQYPEPPEGWNEGDCQSTRIQSPINIPSQKSESIVIDNGTHAKIKQFSYTNINSARVKFDNGHKWTTEELNVGNLEIELNQTVYTYKLNSIHFHLYSEHRIENHQYPMEMHIVHKNTDQADKDNENLVIGILFDYNSEEDNKFLKDMKLASEEEINEANILSLIDKNDEFYYYKGSLTTDPCTENVNWIVFRKILHMSYNQFHEFEKWIEKSIPQYYGVGYGNARGPKRLSERIIYLENLKSDSTSGSSFENLKFGIFILFILFIY